MRSSGAHFARFERVGEVSPRAVPPCVDDPWATPVVGAKGVRCRGQRGGGGKPGRADQRRRALSRGKVGRGDFSEFQVGRHVFVRGSDRAATFDQHLVSKSGFSVPHVGHTDAPQDWSHGP